MAAKKVAAESEPRKPKAVEVVLSDGRIVTLREPGPHEYLRLMAAQKGVTLPADLLGKQKTISQMVSINFILLSLMLTEDWPRFLGGYMKTFEQWFPTITFWLMLLTVLLTVISGVSYLIRGHRLYTHDT